MANEYIIKNGLVVSGSSSFLGPILSSDVNSLTQSFQQYSASLNIWTGSIEIFTSSVIRDSASFDTRINLKTDQIVFVAFSQSIHLYTASVKLDSASFDSRINLKTDQTIFVAYSQSLNLFTASVKLDSASFDLRINNKLDISEFRPWSQSINVFTASVIRDSASFDSRINSIVGGSGVSNNVFTAYSQSINLWTASINDKTASFATTGSNDFIGVEKIEGSVIVSGSLTVSGSFHLISEYSASDPAIPAEGVVLFTRRKAGRRMAAQMGPSGIDYQFQPVLFANKIGWWTAVGNSAIVSTSSFHQMITGSATTRNVSFTEGFLSTLRRVGYVTVNAASQSAGTRHGAAQFGRGQAAGYGGFYYVSRFGIQNTGSDYARMRIFVGLMERVLPFAYNQQPSAQVNCLYVGKDSGSNSSFEFGYNDSTGAATTASISSSIRFNVSGAYEFRLFCPAFGSTIYFALTRLDILSEYAEWSTSIDIPSVSTSLSPQMIVNTGASSMGVISIDPISQYIETDN